MFYTIVGTQWGDEGKGKIVDWISSKADISLWIPDFDFRLREFFISSYDGEIPDDRIFLFI